MVEMIDISEKKPIEREASASGRIILKRETIQKIKDKEIKKGDPLAVAEIAAINASKQTQLLIPLCHQIPLGKVDLKFEVREDYIEAVCCVKTVAKTGVEIEALVGVSIALNTIWDMVKYLEKDENGQYPNTRITDIKVVEKIKNE